ncbi:hypothetical protein L345_14410, partial [Ophiophagus hannah]
MLIYLVLGASTKSLTPRWPTWRRTSPRTGRCPRRRSPRDTSRTTLKRWLATPLKVN